MPTAISLYSCGVWFVVGLCVGMGWALGQAIVSRILR